VSPALIERGSVSVSLGTGVANSSQLLELSLRVGSSDVRGLVDSGATHNFASANIVAKLALPISDRPLMSVRLANGRSVMSTGVVTIKCSMADGLVHIV
jgi:hypothetical protein